MDGGATAEVVTRTGTRYLLVEHTGSPAAVRNAAMRARTAPYVAFLDPDGAWLPGKLERQLAAERLPDSSSSEQRLLEIWLDPA